MQAARRLTLLLMLRTVLRDSPHSKITALLFLPTDQRRQEQTFPPQFGASPHFGAGVAQSSGQENIRGLLVC